MQSPTTAFLAGALLLAVNLHAENQRTKIMNNNITPQKLVLTQEWDKTFPKSDKVNHRKVTFVNRYGITSRWRRTSMNRKTPPENSQPSR